MDKQKKNEELQSRREFFKKAAKVALPFVAVVALAGNPVITKAAETAMGCEASSCSGYCKYGCSTTCSGTCSGSCKTYCTTTCSGTCSGSCKGTCISNCAKYSK